MRKQQEMDMGDRRNRDTKGTEEDKTGGQWRRMNEEMGNG